MRAEDVIDMQEAANMHEAMDYAQHHHMWHLFVTLVKWTIFEAVVLMLALYCFIEAHNSLLGWLLIAAGLLAIPGKLLFGRR